jgi:capsid protein
MARKPIISPMEARILRGALAVTRSFAGAWNGVASMLGGWTGGYPSADPRRKILEDWRPRPATANQALVPSLQTIIAQLRHLDRSAPTLRALVEGRKAELVGTGITVKPNTGDKTRDRAITAEWHAWCKVAGLDGSSLWTLQRMASGEIDLAGTALWKWVSDPALMRAGHLPLRLQALEVEDLSAFPVAPIADGNTYVNGVEMRGADPVGYHVRDSERPFDEGAVIPAAEVQATFERRRAKMVLGEPRLACLVERTLQDDEIIISELKTARSMSATGMIIADDDLFAAVNDAEDPVLPTEVNPAGVAYLPSGASPTIVQNTRPSASVKDFRSTTRGDQAGGAQTSRVWIDRDGSAYNFANSKFDQIRTQMVVRPAHDWFGEGVAGKVYLRVLPWILLRLGIAMPSNSAARAELMRYELVPDVPSELDEQASADAFSTGYAQGITSRTSFLGSRGKDPEQIAEERDAEARDDAARVIARVGFMQRQIEKVNAENPGLNLTWDVVAAINGAISAPGAFLQGTAAAKNSQTAAATNPDATAPDASLANA